MDRKYELITTDKITVMGHDLYRIRALKDIAGVCEVGDIGGYVRWEGSLSQDGNAWVYGDAQVYGNALVYGNAQVYGNARVHGNAWVYGDAQVYGNARVHGNAWVYGDAQVYGNALVYGNAQVYGNAWVYGNAQVGSTPVQMTWANFDLTAYCDFVQIGCKLHTQKEWAAIFKLGTYRGLCESEAEYEVYQAMFKTAVAMLKI